MLKSWAIPPATYRWLHFLKFAYLIVSFLRSTSTAQRRKYRWPIEGFLNESSLVHAPRTGKQKVLPKVSISISTGGSAVDSVGKPQGHLSVALGGSFPSPGEKFQSSVYRTGPLRNLATSVNGPVGLKMRNLIRMGVGWLTASKKVCDTRSFRHRGFSGRIRIAYPHRLLITPLTPIIGSSSKNLSII
jgi:hypothetical protein